MTTNKEQIESLEANVSSLQENFGRMETELVGKMQSMEETFRRLIEALNLNKEGSNSNSIGQISPEWPNKGQSLRTDRRIATHLRIQNSSRRFSILQWFWPNGIAQ